MFTRQRTMLVAAIAINMTTVLHHPKWMFLSLLLSWGFPPFLRHWLFFNIFIMDQFLLATWTYDNICFSRRSCEVLPGWLRGNVIWFLGCKCRIPVVHSTWHSKRLHHLNAIHKILPQSTHHMKMLVHSMSRSFHPRSTSHKPNIKRTRSEHSIDMSASTRWHWNKE